MSTEWLRRTSPTKGHDVANCPWAPKGIMASGRHVEAISNKQNHVTNVWQTRDNRSNHVAWETSKWEHACNPQMSSTPRIPVFPVNPTPGSTTYSCTQNSSHEICSLSCNLFPPEINVVNYTQTKQCSVHFKCGLTLAAQLYRPKNHFILN